jgi:hypothetical protein
MTRSSTKAFLISCLLLGAVPAYAADAFSFALLNIPAREVQKSWVQVIKTQEEWATFYGSLVPVRPVPVIDFENYQIVAGGLGMVGNTAGPRLVVERVDELTNQILVSVLIVTPIPGCLGLDAVHYPTTAIVIRKTDKPVQIHSSSATTDCY